MRGNASVGANDLYFSTYPVPANQPGIVFCGPLQVQLPFGNGLRCVHGQSGSLLRSSLAYATNTTLRKRLDLAVPPFVGKLVAGSLWNFQFWFRDPQAGGSAFNTSDALSILFEP